MGVSASLLLAALRAKLKEHDMTYGDFSHKLNVPVSTLKRQLHSTSIGIDKLIEYAAFLNTDLDGLTKTARLLKEQSEKNIGGKNNDIFYRFPHIYDFFYQIRMLYVPIEEVAKQHNLDDDTVYLYLRVLEMMGLLEIIDNNNVNFLTPDYYIFEEGSPLDTLFCQRFKQDVFKQQERPVICMSRIALTEEQVTQLGGDVYEKIKQFNTQNRDLKDSVKLNKNVYLSFTDGNAIQLADELPSLDHALLKEVSMMLETEKEKDTDSSTV